MPTDAAPDRSFAAYLTRDERDQLDARAAQAEQERDDALADRDEARASLRDAMAELRDRTRDWREALEARDVLRAQLDALQPLIEAAKTWRQLRYDRTSSGMDFHTACKALSDVVADLPAAPSLGSPPARAQDDGTLTRRCAHPGCPRTYRADVGPQERGWIRLRGLAVLCSDHAQDAAQPATIAVQPPVHPAEGHREGDTIPEAHTAAEPDRCEHGVSLDEECRPCLVDTYGPDYADPKPAAQPDYHIGRAFAGTVIENVCPCRQAPCGLVVQSTADPDCSHHPTTAARTMRQIHRADQCPAEQAEDDEWDALDKAFRPVLEQAFDAMATERAEG